MAWVIKYKDGAYNQGHGWPVRLEEATRYSTKEEAEQQALDFIDVKCVEEVE